MVEPGCEYRPVAREILQVLAVGASTGGMFQKASVPGPVGVKGAHLRALHKASSVSPVSGFASSPSRTPGRQPAGLSVRAVGHRSVLSVPVSLCSTGVPGQPHTQAGALVCFPNLGVLVMGMRSLFLFHFQIERKLYIYSYSAPLNNQHSLGVTVPTAVPRALHVSALLLTKFL